MTAKSRTAYSYVRFSTPEQAKGWSEERQRKKAEDICTRFGWTLDTSFRLFDKGKSAFHQGYQKDLQKFLEAIRTKKVKPGSVLIVERLDRLNRGEIMVALRLFEEIVRAGIDIQTVDPERLYSVKTLEQPFALIEPLLVFTLNNMESQKKSEHSTDNWAKARIEARENRKPIPGMMPVWMKLVDGRYIIDKAKAKTIKLIFKLVIDKGWGAKRICRYMHENEIPNIALGTRSSAKETWNTSMVRNIVTSRILIGEYQPGIMAGKKIVPEGDPIPDFYPRMIDDATFYAAQAASAKNKTNKGRPGRKTVNLFTGLLFDARTKQTMRVLTSIPKKPRNNRPSGMTRITRLCSWHVEESLSWKYESFEEGFLKFLSEVSFDDLVAEDTSELESLEGQRLEVAANLEKVQARIVAGTAIDSLFPLLTKLDGRKKEIDAAIEEMKTQRAGAKIKPGDILDLAELLASTPEDDQEELRDQIKAKLRLAIDSIWMLIEEYERTRIATVQVFVGDQSRAFVLLRKANRWIYSPMNPKGKWKFDLREWNGKPLYSTYGGVAMLPLDGLD